MIEPKDLDRERRIYYYHNGVIVGLQFLNVEHGKYRFVNLRNERIVALQRKQFYLLYYDIQDLINDIKRMWDEIVEKEYYGLCVVENIVYYDPDTGSATFR